MRKTSTPVLLSISLLNLADVSLRRAERRLKKPYADLKDSLKRVRGDMYGKLLDRSDEFPWYQRMMDHPPRAIKNEEMEEILRDHQYYIQRRRPRLEW